VSGRWRGRQSRRWPTADRGPPAKPAAESSAAALRFERPISNTYFQRDHNLLGDRGPIVANTYDAVRQPEIPLVRTAWEGVGADVAHQVTDEPIEGGDFVPAGEFALIGTPAVVDGEEEILRTSYAAGRQLLAARAVGYDEVGLVRAPLEAGRAPGGEYRKRETTTVLAHLDEKGYDTIDPDWLERWPTNFLTVEDGTVVAIYRDDADGTGEAVRAIRRGGPADQSPSPRTETTRRTTR